MSHWHNILSKIWLIAVGITILCLLWVTLLYFNSAYYLSRGSRQLNGESYQAAVDALEKSLKVEPGNVLAYRRLARTQLQQNQPELARQAIQKALELAPQNPLVLLETGDVYDHLGDKEQAIFYYEMGGVGDRKAQLAINYLQLADQLWARGDEEAAAGIWRDKVRGTDYGDLYANWRLAQYYAKDKETATPYIEAARYFPLESVTPPPDHRLTEYQTQVIMGVVADGIWSRETLLNVVAYRVWQDQSQATEDFLRMLTAGKPDDADMQFYLGEMYQRQGDWIQAETTYRQVLAIDSRYAQAYLRLGMVSEAKCEVRNAECHELQEAAAWYEKYRQLAPDDLLGLKKLVEIAEVLQKADARALRENLESETDDRQIAAELLGADVDAINLEAEILLVNGGFETWYKQQPNGWIWNDHFTRPPFNKGVFIGGPDTLAAIESTASGRVDGLWLQYDEDRSPGRSGWLYKKKIELDLQQNTDYVLSFYYRTENLSDETIQVWLSSGRSERLPGTNGAWRYQAIFILLQNYTPNESVRPMLRIFAPGRLWIDNVSIRPININLN